MRLPCAYDDIGNRITAQEDAESVTYEANNLNQYTQIDTDSTAFVPKYDEDRQPDAHGHLEGAVQRAEPRDTLRG